MHLLRSKSLISVLFAPNARIRRKSTFFPSILGLLFPKVVFDFTSRKSDLRLVRFVENMSTFAQNERTITKKGLLGSARTGPPNPACGAGAAQR